MFVLDPVSMEALPPLCRAIQRVCRVDETEGVRGISFDPTRLSGLQKEAFDDGEIVSEWARWWLNQAERIRQWKGAALVTVEPGLLGKRYVQPLEISVFEHVIGSVRWTIPMGVVLAWGVSNHAMGRRRIRRLPCAGALGVAVDGCAAVLIGQTEDDLGW